MMHIRIDVAFNVGGSNDPHYKFPLLPLVRACLLRSWGLHQAPTLGCCWRSWLPKWSLGILPGIRTGNGWSVYCSQGLGSRFDGLDFEGRRRRHCRATFEFSPMPRYFSPLLLLNLSPGVFEMDSTLKSRSRGTFRLLVFYYRIQRYLLAPWRLSQHHGRLHPQRLRAAATPHQWAIITRTMPNSFN